MSRKRRNLLEQRRAVVRLVHERDTDCVFMATAWGLRGHTELLDGDLTLFPAHCAGPLDVHEIVQRSVRPSAWLEPDLCVLLCRTHHSALDDHPAAAIRLGLLANSWHADNFRNGERIR
jgi:hypothetical protein